MHLKKLILFVALLGTIGITKAAHIVGGDMYYECLGNDQYRVTLKVYKDCFSSGPNVADFDNPAYIAVYDANGVLVQTLQVNYQNRVNIPPVTNNPCISPPANICVEEAIYKFTYTLPPSIGGYDIVYTRCCRNATISNIVNPSGSGATYAVHIDPIANGCNNSPFFNNFPPVLICANEPLVFDHSATDIDGNTLVYSFCQPYIGGDQNDAQPIPPDGPPFNNVTWLSPPYSTNNPLTASPAMSIDPVTGLLTGTPTQVGQYVVGICVKEYNNGVYIGETRRDFQFNVTPCIYNVNADIPIVDLPPNTPPDIKGVYSYECTDLTVNFVNTSTSAAFYHWDFGNLSTFADTSNAFQPSYIYPDTGSYVVTLIANPGLNCADTVKVIVRIFPTFNTDFDFNNICEGEQISFTDLSASTSGAINSWKWTFGNALTSSLRNPTTPYNTDGTYFVKLVSTNVKGCRDSITKTITVYPRPDVDITYTPLCVNTPVFVQSNSSSPNGAITDNDWYIDGNFETSQSSFWITDSSTSTRNIKLIVTTAFGCIDSLTENITFLPLPTPNAIGDTTICERQIANLSAVGGVIYRWSPTTNLSHPDSFATQASPSATTQYTVVVTDANLCVGRDSVTVTINPLPLVDAGLDTFVCIGGDIQFNGTTNGISYYWSPGLLLNDSTILNPRHTPDSSNTFTLYATSQFGCQDSSAIFVEVQFPVEATIDVPPEICIGDTLEFTVIGGKYYEWLTTDVIGALNAATQQVAPQNSTTYTVVAYNDCPAFNDTLDIDVQVNQLPDVYAGQDDTIYRDEATVLPATTSGNQLIWSPVNGLSAADILNPLASPFNTTTYVLTVTDDNGCVNQDSIQVFVEVLNLLLLPNAFSPNRDGSNDVFRFIRTLNIERLLDFKIFNRWGQVVFETQDLNGYWDGTFKGEPQDLGVFVFVVRALNRDGEILTKTGNVTLVR